MTELITNDYIEDTKRLKKQIEGYFITLAERLYTIREQRLWEPNYKNFEECLLDIDVTGGTASKLISIYETFVLGDGLKPEQIAGVSWTTLYEITKIEDPDARKEFIDNSHLLSRKDTSDAIREFKTGCENHDFEEILMGKCKTCGRLVRL